MEVLLKNDVGVVLMDVSMPELDGSNWRALFDNTRALKKPRSFLYPPYT